MRKKILACMILAAMLSVSGCQQGGGENPKGETQQDTSKVDSGEKDKETSTSEEDKKDTEQKEQEKVEKVTIEVYCENADGVVKPKKVEIEKLDEASVWAAIKAENSTFGDSMIISCKIDKTGKKIDLDLNQTFGNALRSMGTTGEDNMITAVVNTFLKAFDCDHILITEEGKTLCSSHKEYIDYMTLRE